MVDISYSRFAPDYSRAEYSELDALSFCLASRLAYAKDPSGGIARERISDQIKAWNFSHVEFIQVVRGRDIDTQGFVVSNKVSG